MFRRRREANPSLKQAEVNKAVHEDIQIHFQKIIAMLTSASSRLERVANGLEERHETNTDS